MLTNIATRVTARSARMARLYSSYQGGSEGATATSKGGFGDKEKAIENQWAHMKDEEKLKKIRELAKHNETLQKENEALKKAKK